MIRVVGTRGSGRTTALIRFVRGALDTSVLVVRSAQLAQLLSGETGLQVFPWSSFCQGWLTGGNCQNVFVDDVDETAALEVLRAEDLAAPVDIYRLALTRIGKGRVRAYSVLGQGPLAFVPTIPWRDWRTP